MEAVQLKNVDDLFQASRDDERIELIDGEIVKRPMARFGHSLAQSGLFGQFFPLSHQGGDGGWWIMTEVSVRYSEHHCPAHDLAGWRKERLPQPPQSVVDIRPDWVCEITSPGHERKDLVTHLLRLQAYQVPYYWVISPEDKTLIAYGLQGEHYQLVFAIECQANAECRSVAIPPFRDLPIDLAVIFGDA